MFSAANVPLVGTYDYGLVVLSVVIAVCASYTALDLTGRVMATFGSTRRMWLAGGATVMGLGIWSMHYIGMLAFHLPIPVAYDWPTVLVSLLAAILASGVALFVVTKERMGLKNAAMGSVVMGAGIATMHYVGMAAMRVAGMCHYSATVVALSILLAVAIAFVGLWLLFNVREENRTSVWRKMVTAAVMGAAIPVMHYTGMAASTFAASD
jgi:NO-binding membrane sensor protein with MHYT domain